MELLYTGYELLWLFFIYSFLGWIFETCTTALRKKRLVNRGLVNLPFCVIYGFTAAFLTLFCVDLTGFWLFLGCMLIATIFEWAAGHLLERIYHERWWDYSKSRFQLDGYISLPTSVLWGVLGYLVIRWGNHFLLYVLHLLPGLLSRILILTLSILLALDICATLVVSSSKSPHAKHWQELDNRLASFTARLTARIHRGILKRIQYAYPAKSRITVVPKEDTSAIFAYGCGFYKLIWLFFIGAFLGDITETIYCRITAGVWMSRSSVVWGPFSIVWGLAIFACTLLLYRYKDKSDSFIFLVGTFLGGAYEYVCSVFTEIMFGQVFWDYSAIPFNLGGRINLLYCFFWGIAAVVWMKKLYPVFSCLIEKIPVKPGKILTWIALVFMICNLIVSCMALARRSQRVDGIAATMSWQMIMDERFDDARMERIYPNALFTE